MRSVRRATALLLNLLLVQLLLAGAGTFGAARSPEPHAAHAAAAAGGTHEHGESHPGCPDCESTSDRSPCDLPWAPGGCATASGCAPAIAESIPASPLLAPSTSGVDAPPTAPPPGPATPPELPPPRA